MSRRVTANLRALMIFLSAALPAQAENYSARVLQKKRFAADTNPLDPNAPASESVPTLPSRPASNAVIEEDLSNPSSKREVRPLDPPPPPPVQDGSSRESAYPPPAPDPRGSQPMPPPSAEEMRPRRSPPPAYEPESRRRHHAGDIDEDGGTGVSFGIGFGSQKFSASLGLTFPIYRWLAWNISGSYHTWAKDDDKETLYGPEGSLILRIPSRIPITPFAGVGAGYGIWKRSQLDEVFDERASLLSLYFLGISIPMSEHLALSMSQTWYTYLGSPPKKFEDHSKYESYGYRRFDVGLAFVF